MKYHLALIALLTAFCLPESTLAQVIDLGTTTRVVVVGISDYQDPAIPDLRFADRDAEAFANFLGSPAGGSISDDHIKLLRNSEATQAQFAIALDWLMELTKEDDQAIIYFSGHGDVEKKTLTQPGFLLCWDAPAKVYLAGGTFALPMLQEVVSTLSIQNKAKVVVVLDACRSGVLAGNSVGGAQATAANLAKQYSNEIKILSCQPNEYSVEGEQWGGGRGAFSFNLVEALYGFADTNKDLFVTLHEVGRYLEDHVTQEVAPISQIPMVIGNRTEKLANVYPALLARLESEKTNQMAMLKGTGSRGIEEEVLAGVDSSLRQAYYSFVNALKTKAFFTAPTGLNDNAFAEHYYEKLMAEAGLEKLHSTIRRNYAAALLDDAQQALNALLKSDPAEMNDFYRNAFKYREYPALIRRASELLGSGHYLLPSLKVKELYFEAYNFIQNDAAATTDTISRKERHFSSRKLLQKAIALQPEAPYLYAQIAFSFGSNIPVMTDSLVYYSKKAIELSPTWQLPYLHVALEYWLNGSHPDTVDHWLGLALAQDSLNYTALERLYWLRGRQGRGEDAEVILKKMLVLRPDIPNAAEGMGSIRFYQRRFAEAEEWFAKAAALKLVSFDVANEYVGFSLLASGQWEAGVKHYQRQIADEHTAFWQKARLYSWLGMGMLYINGDLDGAETAFKAAWKNDNGVKKRAETDAQLAEVACRRGHWQLADSLSSFAMKSDPSPNEAFVLALSAQAQIAAQRGQMPLADSLFRQSIYYPLPSFLYHEMASYQYGVFLLKQKKQNDAELMFDRCDGLALGHSGWSCVGHALTAASRNEIDLAITWLERAFERHFSAINYLRSEPLFDKLEQTEQWVALMKKYFPDHFKD
ncbi:MAG: caspase family protein [Saprospiraceae bacterium]|nr:caspase family protein [Saprospiraceae bacterium]